MAAAQADSQCATMTLAADDLGFPEGLAGTDVTLAQCEDADYLYANLRLGSVGTVPVSGVWSDTETCLSSELSQPIWSGFLDADQRVTVCRDASGVWHGSLSASAVLAGGPVTLQDASFELAVASTGPSSLSIGALKLGPFTLHGAMLVTSTLDGGIMPSQLDANLSVALPGAGSLTVSAAIDAQQAGFSLEFDDPPSGFPFPGVDLPPGDIRMSFEDAQWRLRLSFEGTPELGPLGALPIDAGHLDVVVRPDSTWLLSGCLSSTPTDATLGPIDLTNVEVDVCMGSDGNAELTWAGQGEIPELGLGEAHASGRLAHDNGSWSGSIAFDTPVPAGPLESLALSGEFAVVKPQTEPLSVTGCLTTSARNETLGGLPASVVFSIGNSCIEGDNFALVADGTVTLAGQDVHGRGVFALSADAWSADFSLHNVRFGNYALESATLAMTSEGEATLGAELAIGPFSLRVDGDVQASGAFSLDVSLTEPAQLPNGVVVDSVSGSSLSYDGTVWQLSLTLGINADMAGIAVTGNGAVEVLYNEDTDAWEVSGCVAAATLPPDLPLTSATGEVCWTPEGASINVTGQVDTPGGALTASGSYVVDDEGTRLVLSLGADDARLVLAPGVELEEVTLTIAPNTTGYEVDAKLCLGGMCMDVAGRWTPGGEGYLELSLLVENWQPFDELPLAPFSGQLHGRIEYDAEGTVTVRYQVDSEQTLELAPGLTLTRVFAGGFVDSEGTWKVELGGETHIDFGGHAFDVVVRGSVDSDLTWRLSGNSTLTFEPLASLLGDDVFVVSNPGFEITAGAEGVGIELRGDLAMRVVPGAAPIETTLRGGVTLGANAGVWFVGSLDGLTLPGIGDGEPWALPALYFAATTADLPDFDLLDTPDDETDDVTLKQGVTLTTIAELPVDLVENQPSVRLAVHLGPTGLRVSGALKVDFDLIVPEYNVPTVSRLTFNEMEIDALITTSGKLELGFAGTTTFTPSNQEDPLLANARINVGYQTGQVVFGGQLSIAGRWVEPFGMPRVALQDPAFKLNLSVTTSYPPVPTLNSIGFNGDAFWLKSGDWPVGFSSVDVPVSDNVTHAGATFYFALELTPSGLCLGACLPLPPIIARVELHNLGVNDFVHAANAVQTGLRDFVLAAAPADKADDLQALLPQGEIQPFDSAPLDITVNDFELYLSTHNIEPWPGIAFDAGLRAVLDVEVGSHHTELRGEISDTGLLVEGRVDPLSLGAFSLTGDPFSRIADLSAASAYVQLPPSNRLDISTGTIEGWAKTATAKGGRLYYRRGGTRGVDLRVMAPEKVCDPEGECRALSRLSLWLGDGSESQVVTTEPILTPASWHHLAAVIGDDDVRLVVDGSVQVSAAREVTPDATSLFAIVGYQLAAIDEVRVWSVPRAASDIADSSVRLPRTAITDPDLRVHYPFNLDMSNVVHNRRLYSSNPVHGVFAGGAKSVFDERDQLLYLKLALLFPGAGDSGAYLRAGSSFSPTGSSTPVAFATDLAIGGGEARGSLYTTRVPLLSMPGFGELYADGNGANLVAGDYDDGIFADFDVVDGSFAASGRLVFDPPNATAQNVASVEIDYRCPEGKQCSGLTDRMLSAEGAINLKANLGGGFGELKLSGAAGYHSDTRTLTVDGSLSVFGQTLTSGNIAVSDSDISLSSYVNVGAITGLGLGSQTMSLSYTYDPPRLCGGTHGQLTLPGTQTSITGETQLCLGDSPYVHFNGTVANVWLGGIPVSDANVTLASDSLSMVANVGIPGVFAGSMTGHYRSPSDFELQAQSNLSLGGFSMSNASLTLSPSGFSATGWLDLSVATVHATVQVNKNGQFTLNTNANISLSGFTVTNAALVLTENGLTVNGTVSFLGNYWAISGTVHSDGAFKFSTNMAIAIQGFQFANAALSLAHYTLAHPRGLFDAPPGLRVWGNVTLPYGNNAYLAFRVYPNDTFSANANASLTLRDWNLANGSVVFNNTGLYVQGTITIPGGSLAVDTRLYSSGYFSLTASPSFQSGGFSLSDTQVRFRSWDGMRISGKAQIGSSQITVAGFASNASTWELCSGANQTPSMNSGLPSLNATFCLSRNGGVTRLRGDGTATYKGRSFESDFSISSSGGLDYLYFSHEVDEFSLLGVTVGGRISIKVENNSLTYFRWYGKLYIWGVIDFNGYINLSAYTLCPSHFGINPSYFGLPSGCATLYF